MSLVVIPVTTTSTTNSKIGVSPMGLGAIGLFWCTEYSLFDGRSNDFMATIKTTTPKIKLERIKGFTGNAK
ncbi:hypothetical protein KUL42_26180 [Alteromonas sp. KUL42]|nr:hypothetical protein KUL42_26180 [Alteromonas sp. KUL42]